MKIFSFIPCYFSLKGDGLHERKLAEELGANGTLWVAAFKVLLPNLPDFEFGILSKAQKRKVIQLPVVRPIFAFGFLYGMLFAIILSFCRIFGQKTFDVIYVRDTAASLCFSSLKFLHGIPVVFKLVSFTYDEYFLSSDNAYARLARWVMSNIEKVAARKSDKIIVPSDLFKSELAARYNILISKINTLSVGVDIERFSSQRISHKSNSFTIGYFGSLAKLNDVDCLLESIILLRSQEHIRLLLSTQSNFLKLKEKLCLLSLSEDVKIRKTPHELMPRLMSEVDAIVVPRRRLSSTDLVIPLKLMEAGAARKPVIIARTKIIEFEFKDKEQVLMYEPGNPDDLAAKILQLCKNKALRKNLGNGLFDYAKNHDWSNTSYHLRRILTFNPTKYPNRKHENTDQ